MRRLEVIREMARFKAWEATFKILRDEPKLKRLETEMAEFMSKYRVTSHDIVEARKYRRAH
jgi:hypothetical protein